MGLVAKLGIDLRADQYNQIAFFGNPSVAPVILCGKHIAMTGDSGNAPAIRIGLQRSVADIV
jgi:hypothetical protein